MKNLIGIDPGLTGAIGCITPTCNKAVVFDTPVVPDKGSKHQYNALAIYDYLKMLEPEQTFCIIEQVTAMPGQGSVGTLQMGFGNGMYITILSILGISYQIVHPKTWQKSLGIQSDIVVPKTNDCKTDEELEKRRLLVADRKKDVKNRVYQFVNRLYPGLELITKRGKLLDGRCDALALAEYGKRLYGGIGYDA